MYHKPELLSPVQDFTSLRTAINAGCNAIYFGVKGLNMRANAKNFAIKDLKKVAEICHKNNVRAYLTLNTIVFENEYEAVTNILDEAKKTGIDAIICWDFAVVQEAKKRKLDIHISTQASISNFEAAKIINKKFGVKRIILAREVPLEQIKKIIAKIKEERLNLGIEVFVHGAMCVSISGRCFMSQEIFGKSANRGECLQPCRRKYLLIDSEEGFEYELGEEYVMSPKDLCTIDFIDKLIEAGITGFKIEGRNRSPEYVKATTECYRAAIDAYFEGKYNKKLAFELKEKLKTVYNRGFSSGFYLGKPIAEWSRAYGSKATQKKELVGVVKNYYKKPKVVQVIVQRHGLKTGDTLMIQGPTTGVVSEKINSIYDEKDKSVKKIGKKRIATIKFSHFARKNDKAYIVN